ncbi:MAG: hypothetical protein LLG04_18810 [Parachlamydia sp.]|nr:hypothetical protein [Parachlamydia sp.]
MTYAPINSKTAYLSTAETLPKDQGQLLVKLTSLFTDIANAVNVRQISIYQQNLPVLTGQQFSVPGSNQQKKTPYRQVYYFGAIAAGATLNIAHNITGLVELTNAYGTCVTVNDWRTIPSTSTVALNQQISLRVTAANIEIINGAACPNITSGKVVLEYLLT